MVNYGETFGLPRSRFTPQEQHSVLFGNPSENKKRLQLRFGQLGLIAVVEKFVSLLYYARPTRLHSGLET